jgi:hypothetical protein
VKEIPYDMKRLWGFVKGAKAKTAAEWFKQMPKAKMASGKTTKEWLEGYVGRIIERDYATFGISFNLKGIKFSDPYIQERFETDNKSRGDIEGKYREAFLTYFFDYLFYMKPYDSKRSPEDFYHGLINAQKYASDQLHAKLPQMKQIWLDADKRKIETDRKAAAQIKMVKRGGGPKRKAVA